jgi:type III restriction-modification system methyltransferase
MNDNVEKVDLNRVDWKSSREFFESLGEALNKLEDKDESYDFTWVGKRKSIIEAGAPIDKILRPDVEASKDFDNTKNMLIVGDNLDALKLLQESYLGKIKMIYIDPPYNTGHDFVYHDNFTVKKADFEDNSTDSDGNVIISEDEYAENSKANGRFHSDWLSMMYPRLKLARNLLTDDGVVFISIDYGEHSNLKKLCDEIFGEDNFITEFVWHSNKKGRQMDKNIKTTNEFILCYAKDEQEMTIFDKIVKVDRSGKVERDEISEYQKGYPLHNGTAAFHINNRPNLAYSIYVKPDNTDVITLDEKVKTKNGYVIQESQKGKDLESKGYIRIVPKRNEKYGTQRVWRWGSEKFLREYNTELILAKELDGYYYYQKNRISEDGNTTQKYTNYIDIDSSRGRNDINALFDNKPIFDFSKPVDLLSILMDIATNKSSTVLDFFSGSGTTGHAVMDLNAEDGGKRQYICVQLDEKTDEKSEARKAGYDTIDQITAERLRRAGEKVKSEHPEADIDTGFRVFRVDGSNENENIRKPLGEINQSDMFDMIDNVKKDRTPLDLLFGVIYTSALPFDLKLETRKIGENTVYMYGYLDENTGLIACFDDEVPEETVKEIAKLNPLTVAFKDSSFKDSAEKINLSEHFRIISPDTRVKVI